MFQKYFIDATNCFLKRLAVEFMMKSEYILTGLRSSQHDKLNYLLNFRKLMKLMKFEYFYIIFFDGKNNYWKKKSWYVYWLSYRGLRHDNWMIPWRRLSRWGSPDDYFRLLKSHWRKHHHKSTPWQPSMLCCSDSSASDKKVRRHSWTIFSFFRSSIWLSDFFLFVIYHRSVNVEKQTIFRAIDVGRCFVILRTIVPVDCGI